MEIIATKTRLKSVSFQELGRNMQWRRLIVGIVDVSAGSGCLCCLCWFSVFQLACVDSVGSRKTGLLFVVQSLVLSHLQLSLQSAAVEPAVSPARHETGFTWHHQQNPTQMPEWWNPLVCLPLVSPFTIHCKTLKCSFLESDLARFFHFACGIFLDLTLFHHNSYYSTQLLWSSLKKTTILP